MAFAGRKRISKKFSAVGFGKQIKCSAANASILLFCIEFGVYIHASSAQNAEVQCDVPD